MESLVSPDITLHHTLRISPSYAISELGKSIAAQQEEEAIVTVFRRRGFDIIRGGEPDLTNSCEIGIHAKNTPDVVRGRDIQLAQEADIESDPQIKIPKHYEDFDAILDAKQPLVGKWIGHGGKGKFLLRSEEDKARFLAVAATGNFLWPILRSGQRAEKVQQLLELVRERRFGDIIFEQELPYYSVEEYIEQPTKYNTSFRIVADAYGNIHYGLLLFKTREKTMKKLYQAGNPFDSALRRGGASYDFLMHPQSPLYIPSPDIISNHFGGGEKIRLRGEKIGNALHRSILQAHGIDPDNPQIPRPLAEAAKKIGRAARYDYPFVGVDFVQRKGKGSRPRYYFLEANIGAAVSPYNLDFSESMNNNSDMHIEMMRRVINSMPQELAAPVQEQEIVDVGKLEVPDESV